MQRDLAGEGAVPLEVSVTQPVASMESIENPEPGEVAPEVQRMLREAVEQLQGCDVFRPAPLGVPTGSLGGRGDRPIAPDHPSCSRIDQLEDKHGGILGEFE